MTAPASNRSSAITPSANPFASLSPRVQDYLTALLSMTQSRSRPPVSLILFGSAAQGDFQEHTSDVDLLLVLEDGASRAEISATREAIWELERKHSLRSVPRGFIQTMTDYLGGSLFSCFVCTRADLLSGEVGRVLGLSPIEAALTNRSVLASILLSARTVWGEPLIEKAALLPLRRLDVWLSWLSFVNQLSMTYFAMLLFREATRYAMGALKRSLHAGYFFYTLRTAPLEEEIRFFKERLGPRRAFDELLALRQAYHPSWGFALRCGGLITELHLRALRDNPFPRTLPPSG